MQRREALAAAAAGLTTALSGCLDAVPGFGAGRPPVEEVTVRIVDVRRPSVGVTSATLPVVLEFENTADREVPTPVAEFDVFVEDTPVGDAGAVLTNLAPGETATKVTRVTVQFDDVARGVVEAVRAREFTVRLEGTVESDGASHTTTTEYSYSG